MLLGCHIQGAFGDSLRSCFRYMSSQVTNVIALHFSFLLILPQHFGSYFSTILNYLEQAHNTLNWSV